MSMTLRQDMGPAALSLCRRERGLRIAFLLLLAGLFVGYSISFHRDKPNEWDHCFLTASRALISGDSLYPNHPNRFQYTYPPFLAWLISPLVHVPVFTARAIWYSVLWIGLLGMIITAWKIVASKREGSAWPVGKEWLVLAIGLFVGIKPAMNSLLHHQSDLLLGGLLFLAIWLAHRDRELWAAVFLGVAAAIKSTPLLFCGYFAWKRKWGPALLLAGIAVALNLMPSLVYPARDGKLHAETWVRQIVLPTQTPDRYPGGWNVDVFTNQSLAGSLYAWICSDWEWTDQGLKTGPIEPRLSAGTARTIHRLLALGLVLASCVSSLRRGGSGPTQGQARAFEFGQGLMLMLLLSPMSHKTHFSIMLLPTLLLAHRLIVERQKSAGVFLCLLMILQLGTLRIFGVTFAHWASWHGCQMLNSLVLWAGCVHARWNLASFSGAVSSAECRPMPRAA